MRGFMPDFYRTLEKGKKQYDFTLKAVDQSNYHLIVSADIHVRNRAMTKEEPIRRMMAIPSCALICRICATMCRSCQRAQRSMALTSAI